MFVLTTNRPEVIEPALASRPGRIDLAVSMPLPDEEGRARLLDLYGTGLQLLLRDQARFIAATAGTTPAVHPRGAAPRRPARRRAWGSEPHRRRAARQRHPRAARRHRPADQRAARCPAGPVRCCCPSSVGALGEPQRGVRQQRVTTFVTTPALATPTGQPCRHKKTPPERGFSVTRQERFELPTFGSVDRRSIQLSYWRRGA